MGLRLVHTNDKLPTEIKRYTRCALHSVPMPGNSKTFPEPSQSLEKRHAVTFARLHAENPRLADLVEDISQRYLAEELAWKD